MAEELDGCGHNVVVRNGKEGRLRVHRNVPYEFAITLHGGQSRSWSAKNREKKKKEKVWQRPLPRARCSFGEK